MEAPVARAAGPPRSSSQYQRLNTMTLVSQMAAPVARRTVAVSRFAPLRMPSTNSITASRLSTVMMRMSTRVSRRSTADRRSIRPGSPTTSAHEESQLDQPGTGRSVARCDGPGERAGARPRSGRRSPSASVARRWSVAARGDDATSRPRLPPGVGSWTARGRAPDRSRHHCRPGQALSGLRGRPPGDRSVATALDGSWPRRRSVTVPRGEQTHRRKCPCHQPCCSSSRP